MVDQIRAALDDATYPLVVTEGSTTEKFARIEHSPYLHRGLKSLNACRGKLFIYGHSLDENDAHVLDRIANGSFDSVFVSLFGDPESEANQAIRHRAEVLADRRADNEAGKPLARRRPLQVEFYDAETARIWNLQPRRAASGQQQDSEPTVTLHKPEGRSGG